MDARHFCEFVDHLVDKFCERHPNKVEWTWTSRGTLTQLYSYLDWMSARWVDVDYLGGPSFEPYKDSDHKMLCVSIKLDKARCRISGHWKFNSSLLDWKDFQDQLELMLKRELLGAIIGNSWWGKLKDSIRSFAADYSRRLKLDKVAEQRVVESKLDRVVLVGDNGEASIAKVELATLQNKSCQALVVRARLKRMSWKVANMTQELWVEELRHAVNWHVASVKSVNEQHRTTNDAICKEFWQEFENLFTREPRLSSAQVDPQSCQLPLTYWDWSGWV